eukprot:s79_g41.t1
MTDAALEAMLQRLRLPSSALEELMTLLEAPCATAEASLPAHMQLALQATHTDTHFFIAGQHDQVRTQAGSRLGDPFADVVFGFLFSRILNAVEDRLRAHDLLEHLPLGDPAALTTGILLEVCLEHGVTPNVSRGKTEILLSLRGQGSRGLRRKYFSQQQGQQMPVVHEHGTQSVTVVGSYVHLGGKAHHSGECKVEARRRIGIANEAFAQHRRQLFHNPHIAAERRRELFTTLVLSKLTYGMETWVFDQKDITDYVYSAIMRLYKRVLKIPATQHIEDQELLARVELPSPKTLFRRARLRYLLMLLSCEKVVPWGLFQQDTCWTALVRQDLQWLWTYIQNTSALKDPAHHPHEWLYIMRYHQKYWKTLIHRATKLDILKHKDQWQIRQLHANVFHHLETTGHLGVNRPRAQCPLPEGIGSRQNNLLRQQHDGLLPFQDAAGPLPAPGQRSEEPCSHLDLYESLATLCFDEGHQGLRHLCARGHALLSDQVISWSHLLQTSDKFQKDFTAEDCALASLSESDLMDFLDSLRDLRHWPFLNGEVGALDEKAHVEPLETYEHWCEQLATLPDSEVWQPCLSRPQAVFKERIVLHAYSGRRRVGDLQWFIDACAATHPDASIYVVSIDIVINADHGDIGREDVREMWYAGMRQGYIAGFVSGPPCCTWSVARGKPTNCIKGPGRGPRILRDALHLWGFTSISLKEMEQLFDGHQLLGFSVTSMTIMATTNALGLLEHPAEPAAPEAASIWRVPLLRMLSRLPGMSQFSMSQGLLGAPSPKPTELLALNLPLLPSFLVKWALCKDPPRGKSIGLTESGEYRTAGLKEYPPAMCAAIAHAIFAQISQPPDTAQSVPSGFLSTCQSLVATDLGDQFGPDYVDDEFDFEDFVDWVDECRHDCMMRERKLAGFGWWKVECFRESFKEFDKNGNGHLDPWLFFGWGREVCS